MLAVRGYDFEGFGDGLSEDAAANLLDATRFLVDSLRQHRFQEVVRHDSCAPTV